MVPFFLFPEKSENLLVQFFLKVWNTSMYLMADHIYTKFLLLFFFSKDFSYTRAVRI